MALELCQPAASYRASARADIVLPLPEDDGRIKTINPEGGYMTQRNLGISRQFVDFCSPSLPLPVFDGGAAFGIATFAALAQGATVIANDIEPLHLHYIAHNADDSSARLYLREGALPDSLAFPPGTLSAIHLSRVLHALSPDAVAAVFRNAFTALAPGGRFFAVVASPHHWACPGSWKRTTRA
jgi:SAM-dependent methyltransferase